MRRYAKPALWTVVIFGLWLLIASNILIWGIGKFAYFPHPTWQWLWYFLYLGVNARVDFWLKVSAIIAALIVSPLAIRLLWIGARHARSPKPLYGETRPATQDEMVNSGLRIRDR